MFRKNISLVVGGAGFIGSHLCNALLNKGENIVCVDNLISGNILNIDDLFNRQRFLFVEEDASSCVLLKKIKSKCKASDRFRISDIYYLASIASPKLYLTRPIESLNANIIGLINLLDIAKVYRSRFLYTSTSEIYGDPAISPQPETYTGNVDPINRRSIYDEEKRCGETIVMTYYWAHKINTHIVRLFNTFGPNMGLNDGRVVPNFITQALSNSPITVYGDGQQTRSFCYVDDVIDALIKSINSKYFLPINIGNPYEYYSIIELAMLIKQMTNSQSNIIYKNILDKADPRPNDPVVRQPNITLAKKQLLWEPSTTIQDGLIKTIDYFRSRINVEGNP